MTRSLEDIEVFIHPAEKAVNLAKEDQAEVSRNFYEMLGQQILKDICVTSPSLFMKLFRRAGERSPGILFRERRWFTWERD